MLKNRDVLNISCTTCIYGDLCLSRTLNIEEKNKLDKIITKVRFLEKGEYVYRQSEKLTHFFAIQSGCGKEYTLDKEGNERINNFLFPGDITNLQDIPYGRYSGSFMALTKTTVCLIPIVPLFTLMSVTPNLLKRFIYINSYKMQNDTRIRHTTNAKRRVVDFLLTIRHRLKERQMKEKTKEKNFSLVMSQLDIGNYLGIAYETISRIFHDLQKQKIIQICKKEICILNLSQLENIGSFTESYE